MNDTELKELCIEVYKRTGWVGGEVIRDNPKMSSYNDANILGYFYTTDYLLNKLPKHLNNGESNWLDLSVDSGIEWTAMYEYAKSEYEGQSHMCIDITPLKALLKLTIALDDAGELPHE